MLVALACVFLLTAIAAVVASFHLATFAKWAMERAFPGASVEIHQLDLELPNRLNAGEIVLKSRKDGSTLLSLAGGSVTFNFDDIRARQIGEVRLKQPSVFASPRLSEAFAPSPGSPARKSGAPWTVRRLVCEQGQLNIADYGAQGLTLTTTFSFDFKNFSPAHGAEYHTFELAKLSAALKGESPFLLLEKLQAGFSFDGLKARQIGEIRLVEPVISLSPHVVEQLTPRTKAKPDTAGSGSAPSDNAWTVQKLVSDFGRLQVADYGVPGLVLNTKFALDLKNLSTSQGSELHNLVLWDVYAAAKDEAPFLSLDLIRTSFTLDGITKQRSLASLSLEGGALTFGKSLRDIFSQPKEPGAEPQQPWMLGTLDIHQVIVTVDDDRPGITDITFAINTTLKNLPMAQTASALGAEEQIIEITYLDIPSPRDPLTKVVSMNSIAFRFTLEGLIRKEIADLTITRPTIYVGEDLFWYMEDMQTRFGGSGETSDNAASSGWTIKNLYITRGQLVVGSAGRRQYGIPLNFYTRAQDVSLDNLAALKLQAAMKIPAEKYSFPSYQLEFTTDEGVLRFSYPPEKNEKNLVGEIKIRDLRWRQYKASNSYLSVTFDQKGINGLFGGELYRGQTWGGFSFFFNSDSPWIGWLAGEKIDLKSLTNIISPQNFQMTGPLNFKLQMNAQGKNIDRILGEMHTPKPGKLVIKKLDDMLANLPNTWNLLKQSSTRLALEALRDFEYSKGDGNFWFVRNQGILQLKLQGPYGSRNFDVVLHSDDTPQGQWKNHSANR